MMKPSHLSTPRTLAETTFITGYICSAPDRELTWLDGVVCGLLGVGAFLGLLACMLAYFDVLVP